MITRLLAFAEAFKKYDGLRSFGYRSSAARELIEARDALPEEIYEAIHCDTRVGARYYTVRNLIQSDIPSDAREYLTSALHELAVPYADSIVDLNRAPVAPEPVSFVAPSLSEDA